MPDFPQLFTALEHLDELFSLHATLLTKLEGILQVMKNMFFCFVLFFSLSLLSQLLHPLGITVTKAQIQGLEVVSSLVFLLSKFILCMLSFILS